MDNFLPAIWNRLDAEHPIFTFDQVRRWPMGRLDSLLSAGILQKTTNRSVIACPGCGEDHLEEVAFEVVQDDGEHRAFVPCLELGRVEVEFEHLERWRIDFRRIAQLLSEALETVGEIEEIVSERLLFLGKRSISGRTVELFLVRGLTWKNAFTDIGLHHRIQSAFSPMLFVVGSAPVADQWLSGSISMLSLSSLASWGESQFVIDSDWHHALSNTNQNVTEQERKKSDRLEGGCWLWWQGKRHDIPKGVIYRLLDYMWTREFASYEALEETVFEDPVVPTTIRSRASEANKLFHRIGIPWKLKTNSVQRQLTKHTLE